MKRLGGADDVAASSESGRHTQEWANDSNAGQASARFGSHTLEPILDNPPAALSGAITLNDW
jgi:hypothetical protein